MTKVDIAALRKLIEDVGGPVELHPGHLVDDDHTCDCPYIFDEIHMGGIAQIFVDNGLPISEGGNDAPSAELAKAYLRLIVGAVNALPGLLDRIEHGN